MPVIDVNTDEAALTFTVTAEFPADPARVWKLYEDPRLIERWWGPPGWPATFVEHELAAGGKSHYFMTGEGGTKYHGVWRTVEVDPGSSFTVKDAFADEDGNPDEEKGWTSMFATLEPVTVDGVDGTRTTLVSQFNSAEQLAEMLAMGMAEGIGLSLGQIDGLIAEGAV